MSPILAIKLWLAVKPVKRLRAWRKRRKLRRQLASGQPVDLNAIDADVEREMNSILGGLKSKTVWFGILASIWGLVQVFISSGDFSREALTSLVGGIVVIVLRAVTTKPLSDK